MSAFWVGWISGAVTYAAWSIARAIRRAMHEKIPVAMSCERCGSECRVVSAEESPALHAWAAKIDAPSACKLCLVCENGHESLLLVGGFGGGGDGSAKPAPSSGA